MGDTWFLTDAEKQASLIAWADTRRELTRPGENQPGGHGGEGYPDPCIFPLTDALNALPGVCTVQSCGGHRNISALDGAEYIEPAHLWLKVSEPIFRAFCAHGMELATTPHIEQVRILFHRDLGYVIDLQFAGAERGILAVSASAIQGFFTALVAGEEGR